LHREGAEAEAALDGLMSEENIDAELGNAAVFEVSVQLLQQVLEFRGGERVCRGDFDNLAVAHCELEPVLMLRRKGDLVVGNPPARLIAKGEEVEQLVVIDLVERELRGDVCHVRPCGWSAVPGVIAV